jgi:DnaJ-class molecular chaperone
MTVEKWSPCPRCDAWGEIGKKRKKRKKVCPQCKGKRIVLVAIDGKPVKAKKAVAGK